MMMRLFVSAMVILSLFATTKCAQVVTDLSALEGIVGAERIQQRGAIKCTSCGFSSKASHLVLDQLLGKFDKKYTENGASIYDDGSKFLVFDSEKMNDFKSDVSFVYTHHMSLHDEESTLLSMQSGLKSITSGEATDGQKKMLILVVDGPQATSEYVKTLLEEAWVTLLDKEDIPNLDIMAQIAVHIVSVNGPVSAFAKESVDSIVNDATLEGKSLIEYFKKAPVEASSVLAASSDNDQGVDICKEHVSAAIKWARDAANASLLRLQKIEAANEFAEFIERLIAGAHGQLIDAVKKDGGASVSALSLAKEDISRSVLSMLYPIFRRHVLLAKQEAAVRFNDAVGDDLEVSINILDDLNAARDDAMTNFIRSVRKLIPKGSPKSSWSSGFDQKQLLDSLNIYIESRVDQLKIQGVLSRGRKPVDLSFNLFLNHPLGRDYRQNPLASENGFDEPIFDENSEIGTSTIVHPMLARSILESPEGKLSSKSNRGFFTSSLGEKDNEFSREMFMFPLSIKNPAVSLMASRSSKRKASAPPKKDPTRATLGPERFIRWDLSPLGEVKENIDKLVSSTKETGMGVVDKVLNVVPFFGKGFYKHPPVTYGSKYAANPVSMKN